MQLMGLTDADKGALKYIIKAAMIMNDIFYLQVVVSCILAISLYFCFTSFIGEAYSFNLRFFTIGILVIFGNCCMTIEESSAKSWF